MTLIKYFLALLFFTFTNAQNLQIKLQVLEVHNGPVIKKGDKGTEHNKYGFEGGRAFKYKGEYQLFTAERHGDPILVKMRLAHWKSKDGTKWDRVSTLFESSGDFSGTDKAASIWSPMPIYNSDEDRYNLLYVNYRSKPNDSTGWYLNYEGRIMRAVSTKNGKAGFGGPYKNVSYILEPDKNDGSWVGLQGNDSFFPYKVGNIWYGFYGSAQTQSEMHPSMPLDLNHPKWNLTLAKSPNLSGPWEKLTKDGPVEFHEKFAENPVITHLNNGLYIAMVDGGSKSFGYSISKDGLNWSKAEFIDLEKHTKKWWTIMRTPMGLINEGNNIFTVFFTAYTDKKVSDGEFSEIGMVKFKLVSK